MTFAPAHSLQEFVVISVKDPAVDPAESDLKAYEQDFRYDPSLLAFVPDETPTRFICRILPHRIVARLLDRMIQAGEKGEVRVAINEAALLAFRYGVSDIEGLSGFDRRRHIQSGTPGLIRESWIDEGHLPVDVLIEVGSVILAKSHLSPDERKN